MIKKITAILFILSIIVWVLFDFIYARNWFGWNDIGIYYDGEFISRAYRLCVCDDCLLLLVCTFCANQYFDGIKMMKYVTALCLDLIITGTVFQLHGNPNMENWNRTMFAEIAMLLFIIKIILHKFSPAFRKLKLF